MNKLLLRDTATAAMMTLTDFMSEAQRAVILQNMRGEEGEFFCETTIEQARLVKNMKSTGETAEMENDTPIVELHYFSSYGDWWITEKDIEVDEPQYQAYGLYKVGTMDVAKYGYIPISEIIKNNGEMDLYFKPRTIAELKKECEFQTLV